MFAGIVESVGKVVAVRPGTGAGKDSAAAVRLDVGVGELLAELRPGASVAVNGACLTLVESRRGVGSFDVVPETWRCTNLRRLQPGDAVNIERALRVGDRLDGHFVQGHVDGVGLVDRILREGGECRVWVVAEPELMPYIVRKGSVALDGVSLTVAEVGENRFSVALIPTTLEKTVLGGRRPGDQVNIETDILARLVVSRLEALAGGVTPTPGAGLTWDRLAESGFLP